MRRPTTAASDPAVRFRRPSNTIIPINDSWRLRADAHQWIVERRLGVRRSGISNGQPIWKGVSFQRDLDAAVIRVVDAHLRASRLSDIPEGWLEAIHQLNTKIDAMKLDILRALQEVERG